MLCNPKAGKKEIEKDTDKVGWQWPFATVVSVDRLHLLIYKVTLAENGQRLG